MTFNTPWGTFIYTRILYGLMNMGAMFQRAMYISFVGEKDKILVIHLEYIIILSNSDDEHVSHLLRTFKKYRKFDISMNPKNLFFSMMEGKLLRNIISKEGIRIDPKRVEDISKIELPQNKVEVQ